MRIRGPLGQKGVEMLHGYLEGEALRKHKRQASGLSPETSDLPFISYADIGNSKEEAERA